MTKISIDMDKAIELLEAAVAERGAGYIYHEETLAGGGVGCRYESEGTPSCGVGLALFKVEVPVTTLRIFDNPELFKDVSDGESPRDLEYFGGSIDEIVDSGLSNALGVEMTSGAKAVFSEFQWHQDRQKSWGEALAEAKRKKAFIESLDEAKRKVN